MLLQFCVFFTLLRNLIFGYMTKTELRALCAVKQVRLQTCAKMEKKKNASILRGMIVVQFVEAPRYKPEDGWFDSRLCH